MAMKQLLADEETLNKVTRDENAPEPLRFFAGLVLKYGVVNANYSPVQQSTFGFNASTN